MRRYADRPVLALVAILAEHAAHPDAAEAAEELGMRVSLLGAVARGVPGLEVVKERVDQLVYGVSSPDALR